MLHLVPCYFEAGVIYKVSYGPPFNRFFRKYLKAIYSRVCTGGLKKMIAKSKIKYEDNEEEDEDEEEDDSDEMGE